MKADQLSKSEAHSQSCITHSKRKALLALLFSAPVLLVTWRDLHKPFPVLQNPEAARLGTAYVVGLILYLFLRIKCKHERLWLGPALAGGLVGLLTEFFPGVGGPIATGVNVISLLLWLAATVVSIGFVRATFRDEDRRGSR